MISSAPTSSSPTALLHWEEHGQTHQALWRSENGAGPPRRVLLADARLSAVRAYRRGCAGTGVLWRGGLQYDRP
ncbi:MAG: methyltransferase, partial [Limnohabitans sp.]